MNEEGGHYRDVGPAYTLQGVEWINIEYLDDGRVFVSTNASPPSEIEKGHAVKISLPKPSFLFR